MPWKEKGDPGLRVVDNQWYLLIGLLQADQDVYPVILNEQISYYGEIYVSCKTAR